MSSRDLGRTFPRLRSFSRSLSYLVHARPHPTHRMTFFWSVLCFPLHAVDPVASVSSQSPLRDDVVTHSIMWNWVPGKTYRLQTETETLMSLVPMGREGNQKLIVTQATRIEVRDGKEIGSKELMVHFDRLQGTLSVDDKTFEYDSDNLEQSHPGLREMLANSTERSFILLYDQENRFQGLGAADPPPTQPGETPSLLAIADAKEMAEIFRRSLEMGLPRTEVAPGDKWTSLEKMAFPQAGDLEIRLHGQYQNTVSQTTLPHAKISMQGQITQPIGSGIDPAVERIVTMGEGSTLAGQILFDLKRGVVSLSVLMATLNIIHDDEEFPVRQQVTTRLLGIDDTPGNE